MIGNSIQVLWMTHGTGKDTGEKKSRKPHRVNARLDCDAARRETLSNGIALANIDPVISESFMRILIAN